MVVAVSASDSPGTSWWRAHTRPCRTPRSRLLPACQTGERPATSHRRDARRKGAIMADTALRLARLFVMDAQTWMSRHPGGSGPPW